MKSMIGPKESITVEPELRDDIRFKIDRTVSEVEGRTIERFTSEGYCDYLFARGGEIPTPDSEDFQTGWLAIQTIWDQIKCDHKIGVVSIDDYTQKPPEINDKKIDSIIRSQPDALKKMGIYVPPILRRILEQGADQLDQQDTSLPINLWAVRESKLIPYATTQSCKDRDVILQAAKYITRNGGLRENGYSVVIHPRVLRGQQQTVGRGAIDLIRKVTGRTNREVEEVVVYHSEHIFISNRGGVERERMNPRSAYAFEPIRERDRRFYSLG